MPLSAILKKRLSSLFEELHPLTKHLIFEIKCSQQIAITHVWHLTTVSQVRMVSANQKIVTGIFATFFSKRRNLSGRK